MVTQSPENASSPPDLGDLETLGYKQELHRGLGPFASFASGFSFVSILTTVFELFAFGFGLGGPAYFWTWPLVFISQFAVALTFAELSARYPISGAVYQWSRRVSSDPLGWMAGWLMLIGYIISVAALAIALQLVLPGVWSGFQIIHGSSAATSHTGSENAILLGSICILICMAISSFGVTKMAYLTRIGVSFEIVGVVALVILLLVHAHRGPGVVLHTNGVQGHGSYVGPFLASMIMAAYVFYGFDSAAELSEETRDPRATAPKAIRRCMLVSAVGGGLLIIATMMAAPSLTNGDITSQGIAYVITSELGNTLGRILLAIVAISIFSATLAISASAARVMFSMARDGRLPFARQLSYVSRSHSTPLIPGIVVSLLSIGVLLLNLGNSQVFAAVSGVAVVIVYLAYLMVTVPLLYRRVRGQYDRSNPTGHWSLGRWGVPVNVVAVIGGLFLMINIGWPRVEVYNPAPGTPHFYLHYLPLLFVGGALLIGLIAYPFMKRQQVSTSGVIGSSGAGGPTLVTPAAQDA
jgi:urea carboxylase system permease